MLTLSFALVEARRQYDEMRSSRSALEAEVETAKRESRSAAAELASQLEAWERDRVALETNLKDINEQNSQLQEQMIKISGQLISLRKVTDLPSSTSTDKSDSIDDIRTSEDLLQVIR
ncbi:unnamed protein product [Protopolystoma xenopodis]|uniref:Uncharacterized protein n=1 Tax=Protopolystoma xenopodis TaxID=117903 RepID=A0A448XNG0_9PLAT|nr:unnamed protein product [Protopolystoma xenopodis]